ncbi:unnamed protein product, partial [Didymodactylos carnosus]
DTRGCGSTNSCRDKENSSDLLIDKQSLFSNDKVFTRSRHRRYSNDVQTPFNELSSWIVGRLNENYILSFEEVKEMYLTIINKRNDKLTDHMMRTTTIKNQLKSNLGDKISFIVETKRNGTYIILNDLNKYALIVLKQQITNNNSAISLSTITNQQVKSQEQNDSELILSSITIETERSCQLPFFK